MTTEDELDAAFEVLADRRRRTVVEVLRTVPRGALELPALVDAVASTCDADPDDVAASLYHRHLPKLASAGVIDYDTDEGTITYDSNPLVERCLDVADTHRSDAWIRRSAKSD